MKDIFKLLVNETYEGGERRLDGTFTFPASRLVTPNGHDIPQDLQGPLVCALEAQCGDTVVGIQQMHAFHCRCEIMILLLCLAWVLCEARKIVEYHTPFIERLVNGVAPVPHGDRAIDDDADDEDRQIDHGPN